ncbi:MAG: RNA pyrophosphohydrolase, partial [SAR324 cluster bacterium]
MTAKSFRPNVAAVIMHPSNKKVLMFRRIAKRNEKSELLTD